jgi:hypothetical protein
MGDVVLVIVNVQGLVLVGAPGMVMPVRVGVVPELNVPTSLLLGGAVLNS